MAEKSSELDQNSGNFDEYKEENKLTAANLPNESSLKQYNAEEFDESADTDGATEETDQIRGQIEETRRDLGETIDAIQEKLSFKIFPNKSKIRFRNKLTVRWTRQKIMFTRQQLERRENL